MQFMLGNSAPPCADRGCTDSCSTEAKAHWHNILRGSAKSPTSTGESHCIRDRERVTINTWRRITQLPAHTLCCIWQQSCCPWQQLLFLSSSRHFTLTHSLHSLSNCALNKYAFFIGKYGQSWRRHSSHNTWHELCRNSCSHLLGGGVLPQMAIS
jgi:hypothetical protein